MKPPGDQRRPGGSFHRLGRAVRGHDPVDRPLVHTPLGRFQANDFILQKQFTPFQFGNFLVGRGRTRDNFGQFAIQRLMTPLEFRKMRLQAHPFPPENGGARRDSDGSPTRVGRESV
jgi:hypothetical protein